VGPWQGIGLAIQALHALLQAGPAHEGCRLVVAGGYDPRLAENVEHLKELQLLALDLGLADKVVAGPTLHPVHAHRDMP
jgi:alpha-1,3/alpha-1,6-mannosyltransferase